MKALCSVRAPGTVARWLARDSRVVKQVIKTLTAKIQTQVVRRSRSRNVCSARLGAKKKKGTEE